MPFTAIASTAVAVDRIQALTLVPFLQDHAAAMLRRLGNHALADLVRSGDRSGPDRMATFEQNLPDELYFSDTYNDFENFWRLLLAYQAVADGKTGPDAVVHPWMAEEAARVYAMNC